MARSRLLQVGAVTAAVVALAGCNASKPQTGPPPSGPALVLVTPNPVGVNDFLKLSVRGVEQAAAKHNGSQKVFQSTDPASLQQNLAAAVREKPAVIVAVGFNFADAIAAEAERNPDQKFLFVDSCTTKPFPNVTCAVFREYEGSYLAGAEAGLLSKTGKVGAVVALDTPQFRRFSVPFGQGAEKVKPGSTLTPLYIGGSNPFNDPARAKALTAMLGGQGVDQVMGAASAAGNPGVFEAAKEGAFFAYGVDVNQCPLSPGQVVDNVIKRTDVVISDGVDAILNGQTGATKSYGLKEKGISLTGLEPDAASSQCVVAQQPDVLKRVGELRDQIVSGAITINDPAA
ncbi:BMP family ABC transporter substrate-binding protein [Kibdelosporangium philippinense]|uniref:BMP family ABC transporter substrate-binding protein n=1 Tax=Kibdelosporangium philippinense TaxID=211113 RepID=A0ABS8ZSV4_9PSEU|nr:BMP family ABC transporter substrate-binding protein [Kibdelosporangium philippinense]MCE7010757.1 BMP family ABC transporter substrate-binding protein [Kibdelosporangium philippinense]